MCALCGRGVVVFCALCARGGVRVVARVVFVVVNTNSIGGYQYNMIMNKLNDL